MEAVSIIIVFLYIIIGTAVPIVCGVLAHKKGFNTFGWVMLSLVIGWPAIVIVACIRSKKNGTQTSYSTSGTYSYSPTGEYTVSANRSSHYTPTDSNGTPSADSELEQMGEKFKSFIEEQ
ncbi:MAG: hypothetical protein IJ515_00780 [Clostridia bacterium]|nr:hypothetical protein [Clostridia bacterium]